MLNSIKHIFFWLSGNGSEVLDRCPNWEQRKAVAYGATVLVPCLFGFIAAAFAVSTLSDDPWMIYGIAAVWAFIVLSIDRALLTSYRPYLAWHRKLSQFGLRFLVAVLLGITIAHPLTLMLFRDAIRTEIETDRLEEIEELRAAHASTRARLEARIAKTEAAIAEQRQLLNASFETNFLETPEENAAERATAKFTAHQAANDLLESRVNQAQAPIQSRLTAVEKQIDSLVPQVEKVQSELAFWQTEFEREIDGQRSGIVGVGPRARSIETDQIEWRRAEVTRLTAELEQASFERQRLEESLSTAKNQLLDQFAEMQAAEVEQIKEQLTSQRAIKEQIAQAQAQQFVDQQEQIRIGIHRQIEIRTGELEQLHAELAALSQEQREEIQILQDASRSDLLTQSIALHNLFEKPEAGGDFAWTAYLMLIGLFLLVDTIPLVVKMFSKPGPYDLLVDSDEFRFHHDHQAFRTNYRQYMDKATADGLAAITRDQPLEAALTSGIEKSRAAKIFLESLMELEQAFQQRMAAERSAIKDSEADPSTHTKRLQALDSMANAFEADIRAQMQKFFNPSPLDSKFQA